MPNDFPKWQLVYYYFSLWKNTGVYDEILATLNKEVRKSNGRHNSPSPGVIDSKSMRTYHHCDKEKGIDGNKKIKGIKLQIIVDCLGLILAVYGHAANIHDSKVAYETVRRLDYNYERLKKVISDGGYRGDDLKHLIKNQFSIDFEVRTKDVECKKEFTPIPQRWKVERTFSWLENFRRLSMDYEYHIDSFEAMVKIAAIKIAFKKI